MCVVIFASASRAADNASVTTLSVVMLPTLCCSFDKAGVFNTILVRQDFEGLRGHWGKMRVRAGLRHKQFVAKAAQ